MSDRNMTYEGLGQSIADEVNEEIRYNGNLSDGDEYTDKIVWQMCMDKACEETPDYLDHYDVDDKAMETVDNVWSS